jgi:hypothetical protein
LKNTILVIIAITLNAEGFALKYAQ